MAESVFRTALTAAAFAWASAPATAAPIDEVIAAERAFADETREVGFKRGFLAWVADDGFIFAPGPRPARPGLEALPDAAPPGPPLFWWPEFAGVANSGDLGFTTGGATIPVRYFTVWQRQADGRWRWIYDGGPPLAASMAQHQGEVVRLPAASAAAGSAEAALRELEPIETELARRALTDAAAARQAWLAEEAIVAGSPITTRPGSADHAAELARQPARQTLRPLGATASRAGDMVFTWGSAEWQAEGAVRGGHYVRIWQKREAGWRLVADIVIPGRG